MSIKTKAFLWILFIISMVCFAFYPEVSVVTSSAILSLIAGPMLSFFPSVIYDSLYMSDNVHMPYMTLLWFVSLGMYLLFRFTRQKLLRW